MPEASADYLIVGSGLTGATLARALTEAGRKVLVVERRLHIGGNVHDYMHPSGIRIHTYGPHSFRTNSERIWGFVNRFARFHPFHPEVKTLVNGSLENWPVAASYIRRLIGMDWQPAFNGVPANFEEASLAMMPRLIYETFVKGYTEKQWGVPATTLDASLARRFDIREDDEPRLMRHKYQGLPEQGYSRFMANLLAGIPVELGCDYLKHRHRLTARHGVIFTGPVDEYFDFDMGRLKYRGQRREHIYREDLTFSQPCWQVNNPDMASGPHIRTLEWKHLLNGESAVSVRGTVVTREIPFTPEDPDHYEYPFPDTTNAQLYQSYRDRARRIPGLLVCGRLGEYRYYDMDQAIARALTLARRILSGGSNLG